MTEVFLDTNIAIDYFIDREPFSEHASELFSLIEAKKIKASISALSYTNIYYVLRKYAIHSVIMQNLTFLSQLCYVCPVDGIVLQKAIESEFGDFEDAVQYYSAAQNSNCKVIISRNEKDFMHSEIAVMSTERFLESYSLI